jgi:hypothetical protein
MGFAGVVRSDAFMKTSQDVIKGGRLARRLLFQQRLRLPSRQGGVRRLVAQAAEVSGDGVRDLATHLLHGRVIEVQRMHVPGAQRPFAFPLGFGAGLALPFFAATARAGCGDFAAALAALAGFAALAALGAGGAALFAGFAAGAAATGAAGFGGGAGEGGRDGARELVLRGGRGCFRGRPLFRAA